MKPAHHFVEWVKEAESPADATRLHYLAMRLALAEEDIAELKRIIRELLEPQPVEIETDPFA